MRQDAPVGLLVGTIVCFIVVNVVIAQMILLAFFPDSRRRFGAAVLTTVAVVALGCVGYTVMAWRRYLKRPPRET